MNAILDDIKKILDNPLWHLCRSNTENAMSNFWAYLMEQNNNDLAIIIGKGNANKHEGNVNCILREKNHMDLQVIFENGSIVVIENKFKSLADRKQIDKYENKIKELGGDKYHFYLITPTGYEDFTNDKLTWLSYQNVYHNITEEKNSFKKGKEIIGKYLELLKDILDLCTTTKGDPELCFFWKEIDNNKKTLIEELKEEKLYAFIAKNLASNYQRELNKELKELEGIVETECGFTCTWPLMSWMKKNKKGYIEGIQIQNGQFRLFVLSEDKKSDVKKEDLNEWVATLNSEGLVVNSRKEYNKFGVCFKYKYFNIGSKEALEENLKKVFNYWKNQSH